MTVKLHFTNVVWHKSGSHTNNNYVALVITINSALEAWEDWHYTQCLNFHLYIVFMLVKISDQIPQPICSLWTSNCKENGHIQNLINCNVQCSSRVSEMSIWNKIILLANKLTSSTQLQKLKANFKGKVQYFHNKLEDHHITINHVLIKTRISRSFQWR